VSTEKGHETYITEERDNRGTRVRRYVDMEIPKMHIFILKTD